MHIGRKLAVGLGALALAAPASAIGGKDTKNYNAKGTYLGDGIVAVEKGNSAVKRAGWKGQEVAFDLSEADIRVEDNNGDGEESLDDVAMGSDVRVKARLPKGELGAGPYKAQRLDDKSEDGEDSGEDDDSGDDGSENSDR